MNIDSAKFYTLYLAKRVNKELFDKMDLYRLYEESLVYVERIWEERFVLSTEENEYFRNKTQTKDSLQYGNIYCQYPEIKKKYYFIRENWIAVES